MKALELKVPPVAVLLLCGGGMWLLSSLAPALALSIPGRRLLAVVVACAGLATGLAGVLAFRAAQTTFDPRYPHQSSALVRTGMYRRSRNPMYLGLLLMLLGWATFLANGLAFMVLPVFVLYMNRFQIVPEEHAMLASFGDEYRDYRVAVRRWI